MFIYLTKFPLLYE